MNNFTEEKYDYIADDKIYMKKDIKSHHIFENHPNLIFGMILLVWGVIFLFSMFLATMFLFFLSIAMLIPITIFYIKNNEKTNLTKSSAFIEREGIIYYIRLGYTLDFQQADMPLVPGKDPFLAKKAGLARENMEKTKHIQEIREYENTFSKALTNVLNSNHLPPDVVQFCEMRDCRLEKETKQWVWLSYYNQYTVNRVTQKFRNVYDFSFAKNN